MPPGIQPPIGRHMEKLESAPSVALFCHAALYWNLLATDRVDSREVVLWGVSMSNVQSFLLGAMLLLSPHEEIESAWSLSSSMHAVAGAVQRYEALFKAVLSAAIL